MTTIKKDAGPYIYAQDDLAQARPPALLAGLVQLSLPASVDADRT